MISRVDVIFLISYDFLRFPTNFLTNFAINLEFWELFSLPFDLYDLYEIILFFFEIIHQHTKNDIPKIITCKVFFDPLSVITYLGSQAREMLNLRGQAIQQALQVLTTRMSEADDFPV